MGNIAFHRRRIGGLIGACLMMSTVLTVADVRLAAAVEAADVGGIVNGLGVLTDSLGGLPSVDSLSEPIPFTGTTPADLVGLDDFLTALDAELAGFSGTTASALDSFLDDPDGVNGAANDGTIAGRTIDVGGSVSGSGPFSVSLSISISGDAIAVPFILTAPDGNGDSLPDSAISGNLAIDVDAAVTFSIAYDAAQGAHAFRILNSSGTVAFDASATLSAAAVNIGILDATASGNVAMTGSVTVALVDPDGSGGVTPDELTTTAPGDLFSASFGSFSASGLLNIGASINGLGAVTATVSVAGTTPANTTTTFSLGALADFQNASPLDIINAIAQFASSLGAMQTSGLADVSLPFTNQSLGEVFDLAKDLKQFLIDNHITTAADPLSPGSDPMFLSHLTDFDTLGEVATLLASSLGVSDVPLGYNPANKHLTFGISDTFTADVAVKPDFGDEVATIGIASVDAGSSSATVAANATIDLTFGIDLGTTAATPFPDRLFIDATTSGPELQIDLPISADIDMGAAIGFVGMHLTDSNPSGPVSLLAKRAGDATPMLAFDVADGPVDDGVLTLGELFTALEANSVGSLGTLSINAAVPPTTITATASASGTTLATGTFSVSWPDITVGSPTVTANTDFAANLLDFSFDAANPQQLLIQVLDAVQALVDTFDSVVNSSPTLNASLPIIGTSFQQIADRFDQLRDALNAVIADPENTLQTFETQLESVLGDALGIAPGSRASLLTFGLDTTGPNTVILASLDLGICSAPGTGCTLVVPISKGINLDLGSSSLAGVSGGGVLSLDYAATFSLDVGVELPQVTPGAPPTVTGSVVPFVLDSSQVDLSVGATAATTFQAYLGPINADLGVSGDEAEAKVGARFLLANPGYGGAGVNRVPLGDVGTFLTGAVPTNISPAVPVSCGGGTPGAACAKLPVYFGGNKLGDITFLAPDLLDPSGWTFSGVQAVLDQLVSQAWDFTTLLQGLQAVLTQIQEATDGQSFGASVPILGDALDAGADVAGALNDNVVTPINNVLSQLNTLANASDLATVLDDALTNAIPPNLLVDRNANNDNTDDVVINLSCTDGAGGEQPCGPTQTLLEVLDVELELSIGDSIDTAIPFDLGLPGLSLQVKDRADPGDDLTAGVGWKLDLAFGISRTDGFYLRTDNPISGASAPEISIDAHVDMPDDVFGTLAFIPVALSDDHAGNDLQVQLGVNLQTANSDRLSLGQLLAGLDPGVGIAVTIGGNLDLHLGFATGLSPSEIANLGQSAPKLPVFKGTFNMTWAFGTGVDIGTFGQSTDFDISITDVKLNVGSFIGDFLRPITGELDRFARPLKPVLDVLNAPIPGIKEIAELVGQNPPTMLDLIDLQNGPDSTVLIRRLIVLVDFITALNDPQSAGDIDLGDLIIKPEVAKAGALSGAEADKLIDSVISSLPPALAKPIDAIKDKVGGVLADKIGSAQDQGGFSFPAFDNPSSLIGILIGQDVDLVRFDAGKLEAEFSKTFKFGPPIGPLPISVGATVSFKVTGHLQIGYDTRGIRSAISRITNDDPSDDGLFGTIATLLQGVYFDDNKDGVDVPEISLFGSVSVQAALDVLIAEAGIRGGVAANLDLNLHDGGPIGEPAKPEDLDGKLRIDEIIRAIAKNPLCLFDTNGKLTVFLELYEDNIFTGEDTWPLASATLVNFDDLFVDLCTETPVLAHPEGGVLVLHVGPYHDQRGIDEGEINETMTVRQTGPNSVSVSGFGFQEEHDNVTSIFADGGDGNDNLAMQAGGTPVVNQDGGVSSTAQAFNLPVVMCGGPGDDNLVGGDAVDTILGDGHQDGGNLSCVGDSTGGADHINGGGGGDNLSGQGGNDVIGGDGGNDSMFGNEGSDTMNGGPGDDGMSGGAEADNLIGGDGNDTIGGDSGDDTITAGTGNDMAFGGDDNDRIDGSVGDDGLNGGNGNDTILSGDGTDTAHGDAGDDDINGDAGPDALFGDGGGDDIIGGADGDTIHGGLGRDYVVGDDGTIVRGAGASDGTATVGAATSGNDTITGDGDPDVLYGGRGADTMNGNAGADLMYGGDDGDTMSGDADPDTMYGERGNDTMHGNAGADYMRGGDDADTMFGDEDNDEMYGDSGADTMEGNDLVDNMHGGIGNDCMAGNNGDDVMFGDANDDRMVGGSFAAALPDGADSMDGGGGDDVMTGDNADVCNGALVLHDQPFLSGIAPDPSWSGDDSMSGGDGADLMYGQGRDETLISGGPGNDYIEGNGGDDYLDGGDGDDDMIGGNGHDLGGTAGAERLFPNVADGSDELHGGGGADHMAGDNAVLRRVPSRTLELLDVEFLGAVVDPNAGGPDALFGGDGPDVAYGQADNDSIEGEAGDDYLEGNSGVDTINGGTGQDDMIGGSGRDDGPHTAPATFRRLANVLDEGDIMDGGSEQDVMLGDNGSVVRPGSTGLFGTIDRAVELYDVEKVGGAAVSSLVSGGEQPMVGGSGNDTMFGQGGADLMLAGDGEDYVEGNHDGDVLYGGAGQDDLVGGGSANDGIIDADRVGDGLLDGSDFIAGDATSVADSTLEGTAFGNGADVTMGDNARVIKLTSGANWQIDEGTLDIVRSIVQFDVEDAGTAPAPIVVHGDDTLYGNSNDDVMRGQGGADQMFGGAGDDDMEGNPGIDTMYGQADQDDMIGGSRVANRRDAGDLMYGGPGADFQLGDNGLVVREVTGHGQYRMYVEANPTTIVRTTTRFDLAGNAAAFGADQMFGEGGDDYQWGQDGSDQMYGGTENDDMIGELGDDRMYGQQGEDAMLGDRGGIVDRKIDGSAGDPAQFSVSLSAPPAETFVGFRSGTLDRRVDMRSDPNSIGTGFSAALLAKPGTTDGGADIMLGGPDRDSMHGGFGNDVMNGESGGDTLFGDHGADVMWGGKGCDPALDGATACPNLGVRGTNDKFVDYLFGGYGGPPGSGDESAADILDYRPRPGIDPAIWFEVTSTGVGLPVADHQHHQGVDWIYGGWDRDVMEADQAANGPNPGDRLIDWPGATQLFLHCNAAYGGFNDVREHSPGMQSFLVTLAYALGAGPSAADVEIAGRSGFVDLGLVYSKDIKNNSGRAFSDTPGHFTDISCEP